MDDFFRLNGNVMSAKSVTPSLDGVPYAGIIKTDYEDALEVETVHGMNKDGTPLGSTEGQYTVSSANFTVLKDVWMVKMMPQLLALGLVYLAPGSYGGARFVYSIQYQEGLVVGLDTLEGCRIIGTKDSIDAGTGKAVMEVKLWAKILRRSGATLFNPIRIP